MWLIRPKFGESFNIYSDISIDGSGIHDGVMLHPWHEMKSCVIDESDKGELEWYFGDGYDERPYSIFITKRDGSRKSIILFGQGLENVVRAGMAINHYSGRDFISKEFIDGDPIPVPLIIGLVVLAALLLFIALH